MATTDAGVQAIHHQIDLGGKVVGQSVEVFLSIMQKNDRRGHFHGHPVIEPTGVFLQPSCSTVHGQRQTLEIRLFQLYDQPGSLVGLPSKFRQGVRVSCAELIPDVFHRLDQVTQTAQRQILRLGQGSLLRALGQKRFQGKHLLRLRGQRVRRSRHLSDDIERLAHHAFGNIPRSLNLTANLLVNPRTQLAQH